METRHETAGRAGRRRAGGVRVLLSVGIALLLIPLLGASTVTGAPSHPGSPDARAAAATNLTGPCALLPDLLQVLANGSDNQTFEWSVLAPIGPVSNNTPVLESVSLPPIYTVGDVRDAWVGICRSVSFTEAYQNLSPVQVGSGFDDPSYYHVSTGAGGASYIENLSIYAEFLWTASCTTSVPVFGPVNLSSVPPYSGTGCGYQEFWGILFGANGSVSSSGPGFDESDVTSGPSPGGPPVVSTPSPTASGASSLLRGTWPIALAVTLVAVGAAAVAVRTRTVGARSVASEDWNRWPAARPRPSAPADGAVEGEAVPTGGPGDSLSDLL